MPRLIRFDEDGHSRIGAAPRTHKIGRQAKDAAIGQNFAAPIRLAAGESAFVANDARVQHFDASETSIERTLAWRSGKIDFVNRPVEEEIAEFNRYNRRQIVMDAPTIGRAQFDGVFRIDDPVGFARAVRDGFGAELDLSDPAFIRITLKS